MLNGEKNDFFVIFCKKSQLKTQCSTTNILIFWKFFIFLHILMGFTIVYFLSKMCFLFSVCIYSKKHIENNFQTKKMYIKCRGCVVFCLSFFCPNEPEQWNSRIFIVFLVAVMINKESWSNKEYQQHLSSFISQISSF